MSQIVVSRFKGAVHPYLQFCDRNSAEVARENAFSSGTRFVAAYLFETCAARNVVFASILITERVAMGPILCRKPRPHI